MSRFLRYEACEKCRERGKDSRGDNLATYSDGGGHCFSCGWHRHPPSSNRWVPRIDAELNNKIKRILPDDFTKDVPARCWQWLLQWGLPYSYWEPLVGYSEKSERLVFRVGEPLQFSLGRLLATSEILAHDKASKRKWHVWGDSHQSVQSFGGGRSITLVEDLLSAHKVLASGNQVVCLFGTRIYPNHLEYLRKESKPINIWLDEDQFPEVYFRAQNLSLLTGLPVSTIRTEKDPKALAFSEIRAKIDECEGIY